MQRETSQSIAFWAEEAFGPVPTLTSLIDRAEREFIELREAVGEGHPAEHVIMEAADIAILLHRLVALSGGDLATAIDAKMAVNRLRRWVPAGDGTGQHIDD